jgi:hypothetical protein
MITIAAIALSVPSRMIDAMRNQPRTVKPTRQRRNRRPLARWNPLPRSREEAADHEKLHRGSQVTWASL